MISLALLFLFWFQYGSSSPQATDKSQAAATTAQETAPQYTQDGKLVFPANYREWTYVTSGVDMDYNPSPAAMGHTMFDNVFVNPEAYRSFLQNGTWPDKTVFVLESRMGESKGSINKAGHYQSTGTMGYAVHLKDEERFGKSGGWAFFGGQSATEPADYIGPKAPCYSCHQQHGAVDTTFVQFYPTLLPVAQAKKTLSASYLKEEAAAPSNKQ